jgi:predicted helicase
MSQLLISQYLNELDRLRKISGTCRERVVQEAFKDLWKAWGKEHDLQFIPDYEIVTPAKNRIYPDGALVYSLRVPFGYWEAKDEEDDLDAEIAKKFKKGYPRDNIIFEDSTEAVLIQNGTEIFRCKVDDPKQLEKLLKLFFAYERPEIAKFRKAVEQFKTDLPAVLSALRDMIDKAEAENAGFREAQIKFLKHAQETINPTVSAADVREMLIQHILTEEIFSKVFDESDFHRQNNVAKALYALEAKFFTGAAKKNTMKGLEPYYAAIRAAAALISTHHEKQAFLKVIYENFYKVYNKKAADRLGVIYTPNEIVRFMIESADWLCEKHFGRRLIDEGVDILDPATGTGTFICELLEHFRGQPLKLRHKYEPWPLARTDTRDEKAATAGLAPKPILKADKKHWIIVLDSETQLSGVPREAWDYRLGNRSALEWILDQYKEKTPKDPTIREKFNPYRFAHYKEKVIDLLGRVTRVSLDTQRVVEAMKGAVR